MTDQKARRAAHPGDGIIFFLGLIGALVYYLQRAHGFWSVVLAILKAFVWPALLVYGALKAVS